MRDLVLLPGWGFDQRIWQPLAALWPAGWRLRYGLAALAECPAGAVVCGWSLGAMQAIELAANSALPISCQHGSGTTGLNNLNVDKLILIGATPRFLQDSDWPAAQAPSLLASFAADLTANPIAALRRFAALLNQGDGRARELTRFMQTLLGQSEPDVDSLLDGLNQLRDRDLRNQLARIQIPTWVVHGSNDVLMPLAAGEWLAEQLPQARLTAFAQAGHAPFLSQPERFSAMLAEFLHD